MSVHDLLNFDLKIGNFDKSTERQMCDKQSGLVIITESETFSQNL